MNKGKREQIEGCYQDGLDSRSLGTMASQERWGGWGMGGNFSASFSQSPSVKLTSSCMNSATFWRVSHTPQPPPAQVPAGSCWAGREAAPKPAHHIRGRQTASWKPGSSPSQQESLLVG